MKVYFVGIKGIGTSALASYFKKTGNEVIGSDTKEKFYSEKILKKYGIKYFEGFDKKNILKSHKEKRIDLVISSAAYYDPKNIKTANPEILAALSLNIPIKTYPQALAEITNKLFTIGVSGSHGKSTTTGLIGLILESAGKDPLVLIGGKSKNWKSSIRIPEKRNKPVQYFVLEADEYREAFLNYNLKSLIINNIAFDHPDYYKTPASYELAFKKLVKKIPRKGIIVGWGDDDKVRKIVNFASAKKRFFGFNKGNDLVISNDRIVKQFQFFNLSWKNKNLGEFKIRFPGKSYLLDAAAASLMALELGVTPKAIKTALEKFLGISRRFDILFKAKNAPILVDDHALSPEQIKSTLEAVKNFWPDKSIIAVFQPHTFTRTEALMKDFAKSFGQSDKVIVLDIYGSAREKNGKVSSKDLVNLAKSFHPQVKHLPTIEKAVSELKKNVFQDSKINPGKIVIISLGCENVWRVPYTIKSTMYKN